MVIDTLAPYGDTTMTAGGMSASARFLDHRGVHRPAAHYRRPSVSGSPARFRRCTSRPTFREATSTTTRWKTATAGGSPPGLIRPAAHISKDTLSGPHRAPQQQRDHHERCDTHERRHARDRPPDRFLRGRWGSGARAASARSARHPHRAVARAAAAARGRGGRGRRRQPVRHRQGLDRRRGDLQRRLRHRLRPVRRRPDHQAQDPGSRSRSRRRRRSPRSCSPASSPATRPTSSTTRAPTRSASPPSSTSSRT